MQIKMALGGGMLLLTSLAVATPAEAALEDCNSKYMCLWGNNDFKWMLVERYQGGYSWWNLTGDENDEMDSWANTSSEYRGCMAEHADGGGSRQTMARVSNDDNVAPWNSDEVSAMRSSGGC